MTSVNTLDYSTRTLHIDGWEGPPLKLPQAVLTWTESREIVSVTIGANPPIRRINTQGDPSEWDESETGTLLVTTVTGATTRGVVTVETVPTTMETGVLRIDFASHKIVLPDVPAGLRDCRRASLQIHQGPGNTATLCVTLDGNRWIGPEPCNPAPLDIGTDWITILSHADPRLERRIPTSVELL